MNQINYYEKIKQELISNEINKKVKTYSINKSDLKTYYNVGKLLSSAGKQYGDNIVGVYSKKLTKELGKGYSKRNLWLMLKFYKLEEKVQTLSAQLTWSHYCELLSLNNVNEINYYIQLSVIQNLSVRQLRAKIKSNEYERLPEKTKNKILNKEETTLIDFIKDPILIKNNKEYNNVSEKVLQKIILEDIPSFLKELGTGFTFIDNEYRIKIGDDYNYIDLLLFNIEFNCYVVVELKATRLKKEHIGQIEIYMNYIDKNLKKITHDKTIGIIICKDNNTFIIEYCSDKRIIAKRYKLI